MLSCSEFTGVPLSTLLEMAGADSKRGRFVLAEGADGSCMTRTIPMEPDRVRRRAGRLGQNGEMLRPENGYPLRLVVPGVQGVSWVKYLRRIEVGDQPYGTKDETIHYVDLMPDGQHRQYTSIQECKSVITTPSGGQVLLDKGFYNVTGLAWSGRGKVKRVDVSVDGGRNWRTARLETPVLSQVPDALQHRLGLGRQARDPAKPRHRRDRLRAAHVSAAARRARHALDLSQQRDPVLAGAGERRGEECPAVVEAAVALALVVACWPRRSRRRPATGLPGIGRAATPAEVAAWDIDVRPDFKGLPAGLGQRRTRARRCGRASAPPATACSANRTRSSTPLVGGTTADDIKTGHVAQPDAPRYPGRTTLMKLSTLSTLWDYINRAMPWNAAQVAHGATRSMPSPPTC